MNQPQPFPHSGMNHNTINHLPQYNNTHENLFQNNTIDNNLFSFNIDNKLNCKKKVKKPEDFCEASYSIKLEEVIILLNNK